MTSQITPKGKDGKDNIARSLRLENPPVLTAKQDVADFKIAVPADLPPMPYDLAIRAELLAADNKTVLLTAVTEARRLAAGK